MQTFWEKDNVHFFLIWGAVALCFIVWQWQHVFAITQWPLDILNNPIGGDFINFWSGFQIAWSKPNALYDADAYNALIDQLYGADMAFHLWSYPPSALLLVAPFSLLPYFSSLMLWSLLGAAWLVHATRAFLPHLSWPWVAFLLTPVIVLNAFTGQMGLFLAAASLTILKHIDTRPVLAGILLGLLTIKPQLGLPWLVLIIALQYWRVAFVASLSALVLIGLSALLFGAELWSAFIKHSQETQSFYIIADYTKEQFFPLLMPSTLVSLKLHGVSFHLASAAQIVVSLFALTALFFALRRNPPTHLRLLLMACAISLCSPYFFYYDLTFLCAAIVIARMHDRPSGLFRAMLGLGYILPLALTPLHIAGITIGPIVFMGIAACAIHSIRTQGTKNSGH